MDGQITGTCCSHGVDVAVQWATMSGKILLSKTQKHQDENREILQKIQKTVGGNRRKQGAVANEDINRVSCVCVSAGVVSVGTWDRRTGRSSLATAPCLRRLPLQLLIL